MPTSPASNDITRTYCTTDDIAPWILPHAVGQGSANQVSVTQALALIADESRLVDGWCAAIGCRTPFPQRQTSGDPSTPVSVRKLVTFRVAAQIAMISARSSANAPDPASLLYMADAILSPSGAGFTGSLVNDLMMEFVVNEPLGDGTLGSTPTEYGWVGNTPMYRLRNPGLIIDANHPFKFLKADGKELSDTAGMPYGPRRLVTIEDATQSVIQVWDYSRVKGNASGISYWFSWKDLNPYSTEPPFISGIASYGG